MRINLDKGTVTMDRSDYNLLNKIKRQYSEEVVKAVAVKKKWVMKKKTNQRLELRRY